jgi:hypothetical protein
VISVLPPGGRTPAGDARWAGAVLLAGEETAGQWARRQLTKLIRTGGRLAVLGVEDRAGAAMGWWHVARPGSWDPPAGSSGTEPGGAGLAYARALCGVFIVTNGYAADWRPPDGTLCPACSEQL